jgi:hypothetical protein
MGLTNAPSGFMRMMNNVFRPYLDKFLLIYLDDLLIHSKSVEEHVEHLEKVLAVLREQRLYAKPSKCEFGVPELSFLGHIVSQAGVRVDPVKVQSVVNWPAPTDIQQLRSFLGMANYFRRFIHNFSSLALPLTDCLKGQEHKRQAITWGPQQETAFAAVKQALTSAPVLKVADPNRPFIIHADSSDFALGGTLLQEFCGALHPVAFHSRKLNPAERNYTVGERELLAIHDSVRLWSHYIAGTSTAVHTDHKGLETFFSQTPLSGRKARWLELLQQHNVKFVYIKGDSNVVADALSRRPDHILAVNSMGISEVSSPGLRRELREAAGHDTAYQELIARVQSGAVRGKQVVDGLVLSGPQQQSRVLMPGSDPLKQFIMSELHDVPTAGHLGYKKTLERVRRHFEWRGMAKDIGSYCSSCPVCMAAKAGTQKPLGLLRPLPVPTQKWESVAMDFVTGLPVTKQGYDALFIVTDRLTKMVRIIPTHTTATAPDTARLFVDNIVRLYGVPKGIVSDRDSKFTSMFWKSMFSMLGTQLHMSSSYHPQTDGQSERSNQTVEQILRCYTSKFMDDWDTHLGLAEFSLNSAISASTGISPFKLMYGFQPSSPLERVLEAFTVDTVDNVKQVHTTAQFLEEMTADLQMAKDSILRAQAQAAIQANKHRRDGAFEMGDLVMLNSAHVNLKGTSRKLKPRWVGPFRVTQLVNNVSVRLELPTTIRLHPVVHISQIKPYVVDPRWEIRNKPPPPVVDADGGVSYIVERIMQHKTVYRGARRTPSSKYLVKWEGYPLWECTWEPESSFDNNVVLQAYKTEMGLV